MVGGAAAEPSPPRAVSVVKRGALGKADSALQELVADPRAGSGLARAAHSRQLRLSGAGRVLADVYVNGDLHRAASRLRAEGMKVEATSDRPGFRIVEGWVPVTAVQKIAGLVSTRAISAVPPYRKDVGSVTSQGDAAHRGPAARATGHDGAGVKVGLISDSIDQQ